jgi:ABC-type oligopeptide transport system substrate-binding subunit
VALLLGGPWRDNLAAPVGPPPAPESQQVLQVGVSSLNTLDPQLVSITDDYEVTQLIFPSLVQLDDHLRVENWAAAHIAISPDGRTYTFTLRQGLAWSNGVPITADDFAFAINRALNPCTRAPAASYYFPIVDAATFHAELCANGAPSGTITTLIGSSLLATDKETLAIHLDHPAAYFLDTLTYPNAWAVPQALISTYGERWTDHLADAGGLGGDLFKVVAWQPGNKLELLRNEHFWGARAKLRELDFTVTADSAKMYANYLDGQGDVSELLPEQFASARLRSDAREIDILSTLSLFLNWSEPPLNDERMRQAFALALNKKQLAQDIFANLATPTNHVVPQGMPGFYSDLIGPDSTKTLTGNLADASASAQAYANDQCGGDLHKCPPVVVGVFDQIPNAATFAAEMRDMWLQAMPGYPISVTVISQSTYFDLVLHDDIGKFQLLTVFWAADYPDPQDWLSNLLLPDSPFNLGHANVPEANTLMRQADADQNTVRRLSEYNQAEQSLVTNVATIPLFQFTWVYMVRPYVTNFQETALDGVSSNTWQRVYIARH